MNNPTIVEWLSKAIGQATRSAKFSVGGSLPGVDHGLVVEGLGAIRLPMKPAMVKKLIAECEVAPYGKGTRTLVDTHVRNTFELDPNKFRLDDRWNSTIAETIQLISESLGLAAEQLEARLYKLLVYQKGGFFLPHRDSEKHDRMVASMIVVLPNPFEGGELIVRHGVVDRTWKFAEAAKGQAPSYAAFYADCEHEVKPVTHGVRLCLAYNLVLKPSGVKPSTTAKPPGPADALAEAIRSWVATRPAEPLVFALEHQYTQHGLSLDLLKGADRPLAELVSVAGEQTGCLVHLAQITRHLSQFADDGSFSRSYSRGYQPRHAKLEIGETYEDELSGTQWVDLDGKEQPWREIAFELSTVVSSVPIEDWKPTTEEFEGYTGNAGNTLDRWYHRSAIVIWHRDHHFDVVVNSDAIDGIPLFTSMVAKLAKTPKKRLEQARIDIRRLGRAIIANWPRRIGGYDHYAKEETSLHDDFSKQLLKLHDRELIAMFLSKAAGQDQKLGLSSFVMAASREFGWTAFAEELKQLLSAPPNLRDMEWLAAFCCDDTVVANKSALARELCALAVERFCQPRPSYDFRIKPQAEASLPTLLQALMAGGRDDDLSRAIAFVQDSPKEFSMEHGQVPCLISLIPWSQKQFGQVPTPLASWLAAVRQQLESATASPPMPPTDWARPADLACTCAYCGQLKTFLTDPKSEVARIPAREDIRQHLSSSIRQHRCDVNDALERKGSPYSLVLTKTNGSFDRAVKQFELNRRLLSILPPAP